jgi:hypothetical protein
MHDAIDMYGDTAISREGGDLVTGLAIDEFHTYRFESVDGNTFWFSVDGLVIFVDTDNDGLVSSFLDLAGHGGCIGSPNNIKNEWDFVRLGTISFGERILASDPPSGYLDPAVYSSLDRFTVTFDSANYVYIDDITVEVTGGIAPQVIQTLRRETDDVDTVEIVLDRALPAGELTRFIFNDGQSRSRTLSVPHSSQGEGWGTDSSGGITDSSTGIAPSPTLVFDKNGAPTEKNGKPSTRRVRYADQRSIRSAGGGPHSGPYVGAPTINVIEYFFSPLTTGACCTSDGACMDVSSDSCTAAQGTYLGDGTPCAGADTNSNGHDDACDFLFPIPTISDWGLIILTLLTLAVGTAILSHHRSNTYS